MDLYDLEPRLIATIKTPAYQYVGGFIPPMEAEMELKPTYEADEATHEREVRERLKRWFVEQLKEQGHPESRAVEVMERGTITVRWA